MDPITAGVLAATVVPLASGAAGEAGKQAWSSLVSCLKTRFAPDQAPTDAVVLEQRPDAANGEVLGTRLVELAQRDREFAEWLHVWLRDAAPLAGNQASVVNVVGNSAQITGGLVQTHTVTGSISFGAPPTPPPSDGR